MGRIAEPAPGIRERVRRPVSRLLENLLSQILVVDDSPMVRKILRRVLEGMGERIVEASNGREALASCSVSMPDAILIDATLPASDSYDFVKQLRRMHGGARPRVVFCMTENDVAQIARAMHEGADDFMMKPFEAEHVRSKFSPVADP